MPCIRNPMAMAIVKLGRSRLAEWAIGVALADSFNVFRIVLARLDERLTGMKRLMRIRDVEETTGIGRSQLLLSDGSGLLAKPG